MPPADIRILLNPTITPDQLFAFYEKNDICEIGIREGGGGAGARPQRCDRGGVPGG
jgi:hypothetical protein